MEEPRPKAAASHAGGAKLFVNIGEGFEYLVEYLLLFSFCNFPLKFFSAARRQLQICMNIRDVYVIFYF